MLCTPPGFGWCDGIHMKIYDILFINIHILTNNNFINVNWHLCYLCKGIVICMSFKTEIEFELPKGYVDEDGNVHKKGVMRLATAADEILPLRDPKVQKNPGYLSIVLLSRVITKLGSLDKIDCKVIEQLFTPDMAYLQSLYQKFNAVEPIMMEVTCPHCDKSFRMEVPLLGED